MNQYFIADCDKDIIRVQEYFHRKEFCFFFFKKMTFVLNPKGFEGKSSLGRAAMRTK